MIRLLRYLSRIPFLVAALLVHASAAQAEFLDENTLHFKVSRDKLARGDVQFSSSYATAEDAARTWPPELDPKKLLEMKDSGNVLTIKAAFIVNKGIRQINDPKLFDTDNVSRIFPQLEVVSVTPSGQCVVETPLPSVPFSGIPSRLRCTLDLRHTPGSTPVSQDANLGTPSAHTEQSCVEFNTLFDGSSAINRYYPIDDRHSLVVSYHTYLLTRTATSKGERYSFFIDLRKKVADRVKEEIGKFIRAMNTSE